MTTVHKSLSRNVNRYFILSWGVGLVVLLFMFFEDAMLTAGVGAAFGVLVGLFQMRALRENPAAFARTVSALDVRHEFVSTNEGKFAFALQWVGAAAVGVVAYFFSRAYFAATFAAGYLALMFIRELITYPTLRSIESHVAQSAA